MNTEQFSALSQVITSVGSPQFAARLTDAASGLAQLDHLALDIVRGPQRQKLSMGISVTSSVFAQAVASSAGPRAAGAGHAQRPGAPRRPVARRLNFDLLDMRSRELDFYRRFGVIDGLELYWQDGQTAFYLDLYRTHRLGGFANSDVAVLTGAADLFASLIELHASLCQLDFGASDSQSEDILQAVVGLLGPGLTPRESAVACRIAAGMDTCEIARDMGVMPATVITFRKRAYAKLGICSRAELFARCFQLLLTAERRGLTSAQTPSPGARAHGLQRAV